MKFKRIYVELSNLCNLSCSFCSKSQRPKRALTVLEFEHIISEIKPYTNNIYLHIKGEPLLYEHLDEVLTICDENNINVRITTNGTMLKEKVNVLINHKSIKQINISLQSEHKKKDYLKDIFEVTEKLSEITVVYRIWLLSNYLIDKNATDIVEKIIDYYKLDKTFIHNLVDKNNLEIRGNLYLNKDNKFTWPSINDTSESVGNCYGTKTHVGILSDGTVVPCCLDSEGIINLGNVFEERFSNIIKSERFKAINHGFKNNKIVEKLCKSCEFRRKFSRRDKKNEL